MKITGTILLVLSIFLGSCSPPPPLKIGFIGPLSGSSSEIGGQGRNCILLRFEEENLAGGLQGRPLELVPLDDQNNKDLALEALKTLEAQGIRIVLAHMNSGASELMVEYANQKGILIFSPIISSAAYTGKDDWFLRGIPTAVDFGAFMASDILPSRNLTRPAFFQDNTNAPFAQSIYRGLKDRLAEKSLNLVWEGSSEGINSVDYDALTQAIKTSGADSLVSVFAPLDMGLIAQNLRLRGVKVPFILAPWTLTPDFIANAGPGSEGTLGVSMVEFNASTPELTVFREKYEKAYGNVAVHTAIMGYEAAEALIQALRRSPDSDPAQVKKALIEIGRFRGLTSDFQIDQYGDCTRPLHFYQVSGGKYVKQN